MTTLDTVPEPTVIDGEIVPGSLQYVTNPHLVGRLVSALLVIVAAIGTAWTEFHDKPYAGLSFLALLVAVGLLAVKARQFNAWDRG